ncbi:hypothetical protein COM49_04790 [Bacillus pseudomycoides]|nr:hypothetical protein COO06_09880 [Bacillus pseudomycoides]PGE00352.1 hypothetical protein COM50_06700 [Bacillus pseudomycoides]PGE05281.1 hypothetical protein COM49_04790 [Bacillus pseudomycoides]PHE63738.1 hypothetical protein COF69_25355 [Bacillus pseudomycoides]PHG18060.1 hypothetical protein COI47_21860 [Bacillus pseudomycoides]
MNINLNLKIYLEGKVEWYMTQNKQSEMCYYSYKGVQKRYRVKVRNDYLFCVVFIMIFISYEKKKVFQYVNK